MFNSKKPTVQLLGRWQPWHDGHTALFKKAHAKTGQVYIMVRDVQGLDDNPFSFNEVRKNIIIALNKAGYNIGIDYDIVKVPNIVDISYGRDVGYTITQHDLGETVHNISATNIRAKMRAEGNL